MDMKKKSTRTATLINEHCNARIWIFRAPSNYQTLGGKEKKKEILNFK